MTQATADTRDDEGNEVGRRSPVSDEADGGAMRARTIARRLPVPSTGDPSPSAPPSLLRAVGLLADGPVPWGRPVPAAGRRLRRRAPARWPSAPIELTRVGKWLEQVPDLRLDGARPSSRAARRATRVVLAAVADRPVHRVDRGVDRRGWRPRCETALGDRRPHPAGTGSRPSRPCRPTRVWWARRRRPRNTRTRSSARSPRACPTPTGPACRTGALVAPVGEPPPTDRRAPGDRADPGRCRRAGGTAAAADTDRPSCPTATPRAPGGAARAPSAAAAARPPGAEGRAGSAAGAAPSAAAGSTTAGSGTLTEAGAARLQAELDELTTGSVDRRSSPGSGPPRSTATSRRTRSTTSAREEQSFLEGRIQALEARLRDGGHRRGARSPARASTRVAW